MREWQFLVGIDGFFSVKGDSTVNVNEKKIRIIKAKNYDRDGNEKVEDLVNEWFFPLLSKAISAAASKFARVLMRNLPSDDDLQFDNFKIVSIQSMHLRFGFYVSVIADEEKTGYAICSPLDRFSSEEGYKLADKRFSIVNNIVRNYKQKHIERSDKKPSVELKRKNGEKLQPGTFEVKGVIQKKSKTLNTVVAV